MIALGLALGGWLKGEIALPARVVIGVAALLLLWLEPTVTAIGLALLAAGLGLHAVTRRRPPDKPSSGRFQHVRDGRGQTELSSRSAAVSTLERSLCARS